MQINTKKFTDISQQFVLGWKVLKLVFECSPKWAGLYLGTSILSGFIPTLTFYIGKLNIDAVINAISQPTQENIVWVLTLICILLAMDSVNSIIGSFVGFSFDYLKDLFNFKFITKTVNHATEIDLSQFESPGFQDKFEKVRQGLSWKPVNALADAVEIISTSTSLISLAILLIKLSPFAPLVIIIFSIPRLIFRFKFAGWTYSITDNRTPESRKAQQVYWVLTSKSNAQEIRALDISDYLVNIFKKINLQFIKDNKKLALKGHFYSFFFELLGTAIYYCLYVYAIFQTIIQKATVGDLTMFIGAIRQFQNVLFGLVRNISRFYEANLFLTNFFEFMELEPKLTKNAHGIELDQNKPLSIEFKNVSFGYEPGRPILKNVSFKLDKTKNLALVGENGAGKTTLVKLLLRLYEADSGEILINGVNVKDITNNSLRQTLSVIFQDFMRYDMTVKENIAFGEIKNFDNLERIKESAKLSGANEFIEQFPLQYDTILGKHWEKGEELSGGQWQKIALARAFFKDSPVLIMDEPTSALDPKSEYEVFKNLVSHTKNKSLILISHRFSTVRLADEIIVLDKGEIIEQGSHEQLMKKNGHYAKLYNLQAKWYK